MCLECRSLWSKKPDSNGPQWTGRSVRESETSTRIQWQDKTEDKDGAIQSLSSMEWNFFIVSANCL